jgi:tetraacyldisaccharide 4'-kinase
MPQLPFGNPDALQLNVEFVPKRMHRVGEENSSDLNQVRGKSCVAFCAIARPESFKDTLVSIGLNVAEFIRFGDHHRYTRSDVRNIQNSFKRHRPDFIMTTEKDSARLLSNEQAEDLTSYPMWYLEIEARVVDKESEFHELLDRIAQQN